MWRTILFLLYNNDRHAQVPNPNSHPRMYAADSNNTFASNNVGDKRMYEFRLRGNSIWLIANKLALNTTKTEFLSIGSRQRLSNVTKDLAIKIDQIPAEQVVNTKPLFVYSSEFKLGIPYFRNLKKGLPLA